MDGRHGGPHTSAGSAPSQGSASLLSQAHDALQRLDLGTSASAPSDRWGALSPEAAAESLQHLREYGETGRDDPVAELRARGALGDLLHVATPAVDETLIAPATLGDGVGLRATRPFYPSPHSHPKATCAAVAKRGYVTLYHAAYTAERKANAGATGAAQKPVMVWQGFAADGPDSEPGLCYPVFRDVAEVISNHRPGGEFRTYDPITNEVGKERYLGKGDYWGRAETEEKWLCARGDYCYIFPADGKDYKWPINLGPYAWIVPPDERLPPHWRVGQGLVDQGPIAGLKYANDDYSRAAGGDICVVTGSVWPTTQKAHLVSKHICVPRDVADRPAVDWYKANDFPSRWWPNPGVKTSHDGPLNTFFVRADVHLLLDQDILAAVAKPEVLVPGTWRLHLHCLVARPDIWLEWHNRPIRRTEASPAAWFARVGLSALAQTVTHAFADVLRAKGLMIRAPGRLDGVVAEVPFDEFDHAGFCDPKAHITQLAGTPSTRSRAGSTVDPTRTPTRTPTVVSAVDSTGRSTRSAPDTYMTGVGTPKPVTPHKRGGGPEPGSGSPFQSPSRKSRNKKGMVTAPLPLPLPPHFSPPPPKVRGSQTQGQSPKPKPKPRAPRKQDRDEEDEWGLSDSELPARRAVELSGRGGSAAKRKRDDRGSLTQGNLVRMAAGVSRAIRGRHEWILRWRVAVDPTEQEDVSHIDSQDEDEDEDEG